MGDAGIELVVLPCSIGMSSSPVEAVIVSASKRGVLIIAELATKFVD